MTQTEQNRGKPHHAITGAEKKTALQTASAEKKELPIRSISAGALFAVKQSLAIRCGTQHPPKQKPREPMYRSVCGKTKPRDSMRHSASAEDAPYRTTGLP